VIQSLTPDQAHALISQGGVEIIDVREPAEWNSGHLPGARLVPLETLRRSPKASLPRDGVVFVCAAGIRSQTAARLAESIGLSTVYNLAGGTRAWVKAGYAHTNEMSVAV
jgi:rhodanese-related sulfurtransferase